MTRHSLSTRLREHVSLVLPDAHGHHQETVSDFALALTSVRSCCQAARALCARLPPARAFRLSLDWTTEARSTYSSPASGVVPLYWHAYYDTALKEWMNRYERMFVRCLFDELLRGVECRCLSLTADRWFAQVSLLGLP